MKQKLFRTSHYFGFFITNFLIIYSSLLDGKSSSRQSQKLASFIEKIFRKKNDITFKLANKKFDIYLINNSNFEYFIRKSIGHFLIFFILSYFTTVCLFFKKKKDEVLYVLSLLYGLFIALLSELLQFIPLNRGPRISDVFIDFTGYFLFLIIFYVLRLFYLLFFKDKNKSNYLNQ